MNEREIFAGAMQRTSEEARASFLDGACGDNVALRRRIEALLAEQAQLGSFLESPPEALVEAAGDTTADAPSRGPTSAWCVMTTMLIPLPLGLEACPPQLRGGEWAAGQLAARRRPFLFNDPQEG
jgi:hypothetical protein